MLKFQISLLGVQAWDPVKLVQRAQKHYERSEKVVRSTAQQLREGKKKLQKTITAYGEPKVQARCNDARAQLTLEGRASRLTDEEIEKSIVRNEQFIIHEGQMARAKALAHYQVRVDSEQAPYMIQISNCTRI